MLTPLESIAEQAGVSKGALSYSFDSRKLFLALLEERLGVGLDDAGTTMEAGDPGAAAAAFQRRLERDPRWLGLLLEFLACGARDEKAARGLVDVFFRPSRERVAAFVLATGANRSDFSAEEVATEEAPRIAASLAAAAAG